MAGNLSDYLENKMLDHTVGKTSFTMPTAHVALFTVAPTDAGGGTEVAGGAYARVATTGGTWTAAAAGASSNAVDINFPEATASWGTIVAAAIFDAATAGNLLWHGPLTTSKTVSSGEQFKFKAGDLDLSLD